MLGSTRPAVLLGIREGSYFAAALRHSHSARSGHPAANQALSSDTDQITFAPIRTGLGSLPPASHVRTVRKPTLSSFATPFASTASGDSLRRCVRRVGGESKRRCQPRATPFGVSEGRFAVQTRGSCNRSASRSRMRSRFARVRVSASRARRASGDGMQASGSYALPGTVCPPSVGQREYRGGGVLISPLRRTYW